MKKRVIKLDRIQITFIIFILLIFALGGRLYFLQVHPTEMVTGEMTNHQTEDISQIRYKIFDTNGKDMMNYNKKYIMVLDTKPFMLNNYEETLEDLMALNFIMKSEDSEFNYTKIMNEGGKRYYKISEETYNKINKLENVKGIYTYIYDEVDSKEAWRVENFLSKVGEKDEVEGSLQSELNKYLASNKYPKSRFYLDDKAVYGEGEVDEGSENKNIKLTINKEWEDKIREILKKEDYDFLKNVGVVVSEADTGKIRAIVQKDETQANVNLGIEQLGYEPGSIFKVITETIGLDLGLIRSTDTFICSGVICSKNGKSYAHGALSVEGALKISCNDVFAKVGSLIGYDKFMEYVEKMGLFKQALGVAGDNKNEAAGVKPKREDSMNNISIGQATMVTPVQMAGLYNTVVNDGVYIKPTIVEEILDKDNNTVHKFLNEPVRVFSQTSAKIAQETMSKVIWEGSGFEAKVEGVKIGGKTGTSTGEGGTNHGWFAGYFIKDEKKYTIVVIAPHIGEKHPDGRELGGGNTGAPIFRDIVTTLVK
ncbi:penicillin-binding transpeptidase domain-containing protein [Clostridium septicum]|uniref:Penicillin-binding protein n=1 Tax=Clostridium septicum TaxID=1504 RepID=A0A9N7PHV0_CLOSE|nr:penicillin-binding transpeptidase domain-containing protein [Clostridium septicum]AYE33150.1 penicillin-binding protein [Clostridium septicum]MDU1314146.1 penicillin-binding transpeptidase domain-containing protein [Clostridium septicum]QAS61320.1 penicillin-binding protein 2 [Clostridium septicum]UEC19325.1 penicillin-binding protein 2 [Clostridium septicum]USR99722.1 penicillin-binding transpeptidase domain-containing protein [Clostridium septicum]